ncbi:MAG: PorP/SprF family type IX secretion system membrane protein [Bacteroidales bacterium]|nr:PorP/SprF family type IX secretion system membrane protein [Bacteroidales bacterium]
MLVLIPFCTAPARTQSTAPFSLFSEIQTYYNPAANGHKEVLSADFFYNQHWIGIPGAMATQAVSVHAPMMNPKVGMGVLVEHDAYGPASYTGLHVSYAYRLSLGNAKLSFGLRAGIVNGATASLSYRDSDEIPDPILDEGGMRFWVPNLGVGIMYYSKKYWVGLAFPRVFGFESNEADNYTINVDFSKRDYFLMAGGTFSISSEFGIEPSMLVKYTPSIPSPVLALNALGVYKGMYKAGVGYRLGDAVIILMSININRQFNVGYSYDLAIGDRAYISSGSHEINLHYKFGYTINASNPRGF